VTEPINWCTYFANIEENPKAITPKLTVRQFMEAREHLHRCDVCFNRSERVLAAAPKDVFPKSGEN